MQPTTDGQPAANLSTPLLPGDVPIHEYDHQTGLAYRVGFKRRVTWRGSESSVTYETWIFSLCRTVARTVAKTGANITIEAEGPDDLSQPGQILLIVKHARQPVGTRARGERGERTSHPTKLVLTPA